LEKPTENCESSECFPAKVANLNRRDFLFGSGAAVISISLPMIGQADVIRKEYPRKKIGKLSELNTNKPIAFRYPWDHENAENYLVKLKETAGGGIGKEKNVVAFNGLCTHQGATLSGDFDAEEGIAGPCSMHWTTFDLTRHGMVITGHATASLPQIMLEPEGDDIYAVGIQGLVFGFHDNLVQPE